MHQWYIPEHPEPIGTKLGPYEEPLRQYLLGNQPFPQNMVLHVSVRLDTFAEAVMMPHSYAEDTFHFHHFAIPGIQFRLYVGSRIPNELFQTCFSQSPERRIMIVPDDDLIGQEVLTDLLRKNRRV